MKFLVFVALVALAGCSDSGSSQPPQGSLLDTSWAGSQQPLRVRVDTARNRLWILGLDYVDVYDISKRQLIRRIELPDWYVADLICEPDLALDRSGTAFISDNIQPRLWQIDPESFQLKEHVIRLLKREHWDIGFGGLAFAPDGSLFGVTASGGSLWSIDIGNAAAHQVEGNAFMPCALTARSLAHEETGGADSLSRP